VTRLAVGGLLGGTLAIAAAYASAFGAAGAPRWAAWAMALGVPLVLVATLTLGAAREGRLPRALVLPFALVGGLLAGGFALALGLPDDLGAAEPLWLGLPRRAAVVVYGIGLLPVLVLPVAYALTFDAQTLREEDLARVRRAGALRRGETPEAPGASERPGGPAVITPRDATLRVGA
jgi:hypothetical protein